jgi:hypothetical protein
MTCRLILVTGPDDEDDETAMVTSTVWKVPGGEAAGLAAQLDEAGYERESEEVATLATVRALAATPLAGAVFIHWIGRGDDEGGT